MSIWQAMRINRWANKQIEKVNGNQKEALERMCLNEYIALCNTGNQEYLRMLQKAQLAGYTKWRKKHLDASPLEFFER